jgi:DNA-binding response OmpR family regulator
MARVLPVEDFDDVRASLAHVLAAECHDVTATRDHDEALQHLSSGSFELVIADVQLPGGLGTDICARARSSGAECLLMTGYDHIA